MEPLAAIDGWMASLFHRVPILDPSLKQVGLGYAKGGKWGWVCLLDVISGRGGGGKTRGPVLYPVAKQADVPLRFGGEIPNPIPDDGDKQAGYPITVTFGDGVRVKDVVATLKEGNRPIEVWLSTPEKPADARYQRNTICLIAKDPLKPRTAYTVTVQANAGGKPFAQTWTFSTGSR